MAAYFSSNIRSFVDTSRDTIVSALHAKYANDGFTTQYTTQTESWNESIPLLQHELSLLLGSVESAWSWGVLLEFPLYRLRRRIDAVILAPAAVVVIELKVGETKFRSPDRRQVEEYALDLRDFHGPSANARIMPVLWCTSATHQYFRHLPGSNGVDEVVNVGSSGLADVLRTLWIRLQTNHYKIEEWELGAYRPVPTVVSAATTLFAGHGVREIAQADAGNLDRCAKKIVEIVGRTKYAGEHALIFVAGVPGSGKTLAGLQVVHSAIETGVEDKGDIVEWHLIKVKLSFMSMFSDVLTCFLTRFVQARIRLGSALDRPRFNPAGSFSYPYLGNEQEQGRCVFFGA